ncbi:MAG: hypothetical protein ACD_62C00127G0014 [uncultured bacterium]|nr:MAG: hypothetical protein ACD_62C00127G0014 [uncultured bacterium]
MFPITISLILFIGLTAFAYSLFKRIAVLLSAKGQESRWDHLLSRLQKVLIFALGQKRLLVRDTPSGIMHALIFWGFCVISIRTITFFAMGYSADFTLPLMETWVGLVYNITLTLFLVLVILACLYGIYRRLIIRPARLTLSLEAVFILCVITILCLSDFLFEGVRYTAMGIADPGAFLSAPFSVLFTGLSLDALTVWGAAFYFIHILSIIGFLNYLPYGKHFHIITSLPNVFLYKTKPVGQLSTIDLTNENATTFGVGRIEQFSWKNYLDWYSCTECGRCSAQCPAHNSEKPLNPKELSITLRNALYGKTGKLVDKCRGKYNGSLDDAGFIPDETPLLGETISHDVLWSCTSCRACEEACPVCIEYVQEIVDMRRHLVLMEGSFPPELQAVFQNLERNGNPWGISFNDRAAWAADLNIPTLADNPHVEYLYFVGCAGSFDEQNKKVSRAFVKLLQKAGVSFGILGVEEKCNGDSARRLGNEYLAQMLMQENIANLNKYNVKKIITTCPHCYNTIKNEYSQFGGNFEVITHTDFLKTLITEGRLKPEKAIAQTLTVHDSCYLGRYNDVYDSPRDVLKAIPGIKLVEMTNSRDTARCCGAGGGRMWLEEKLGKRVNQMRLEDVKTTPAELVATACPFCKTMLTDAIGETKTENLNSRDIAELLLESVGE